MCGIAGYHGINSIGDRQLLSCLNSMKERGPDNQNYISFKDKKKRIYLLHSRLSILDINSRSNQPMTKNGVTLIFNGEIYNYKDLRKNLILKNYKFNTTSDTEVVLNCFIEYKEKAFNLFEGMWAISIWDNNNKKLYLSRDRFGEKPIYYYYENNELYFGSQIKQVEKLSGKRLQINEEHLKNFLLLGYKNVFKSNRCFFKKIKNIKPGHLYVFSGKNITIKKYWSLKYKPDNKIKIEEIIENSKNKLITSIDKQLNADRSIAIMLSGGIDSTAIASIAHKILNKKITTYSIIDKDQRYNETDNINATCQDIGCENRKLKLTEIYKKNLFDDLIKMVKYNNAPTLTITSFISSFLHKMISKDGHRVNLSGVGGDEIYTGYYDHQLFFLAEQKNEKNFTSFFNDWKKNVKPKVRNPFLKKHTYILNNKNFREHIYFTNPNLRNFFFNKNTEKFSEVFFCKDVLRRRMFNELFNEIVPVILNQDDNNHMMNSIENRSPFLDKNLCEFMYTVPSKYLINDGYNKFILRESLKSICNSKVLKDRTKKGFNAPVTNLFNFKNKKFQDYMLDKKSNIYEIVKIEEIKKLMKKNNFLNSESKFLFSFLNCKIFLDIYS